MFNTEYFNRAAEKVPQKYLLVNLAAMRVRQLIDGAEPLVETEEMTPLDVALKEIAEGLISLRAPETMTGEDLFSI